jgi:uncharacterized linocin/CFP29 family protein
MSSNRAALHGGDFMKSGGGRWATEQMIRALSANQPFTTDMLRVAETLRRDEWKAFDTAIIGAGVQRLRAVADLYAAGLVKNIANGFGKTIFEWETVNDMGPAAMSMDGMAKTDNERLDFDSAGVPLPIIHKDFFLHLRHLAASRNGGTPLDTMQAAMSGRVIAETVEDLLINGTDKVFRGLPIYGYTTYPYRNAINFGNSDQAWADAGKTGEEILTDLLTMLSTAKDDRFYGPYVLYVDSATSFKLEEDFKANSDKTIRQRLLEVEGISSIRTLDMLDDNNVLLIQMTSDVVVMLNGADLQAIQWDVEGGMRINFKAMTIQVPLIRSDIDNRCGIVHMS